MIGVLLISGSFLIVILIGIIIIVVQFKRWVELKEIEAVKRIDELQKRIDGTESLFKNEISGLLNQFRNLLK